jgi:small subunit ribosomal protein S18
VTERSTEEAPEAAQPEAAPVAEPAPAAEAAAPADATPAVEAAPIVAAAAAPRRAPRASEGDGRREPRGDGAERGERRRRFGRRKICSFCVDKGQKIDYKDPARLRRYLSDRARIDPRRKTGTCAKHQRWLASALKRARHLALLPYTPEHIRASGMFDRGRR